MADKIVFKNIIGTFVFDNQINVVESHKGDFEKEFKDKYKNAAPPSDKQLYRILEFFTDPEFFEIFFSENLTMTKRAIKDSVDTSNLINQTINTIEETEKVINILTKRLREWYALTAPEFEKSVQDNAKFAELIIKKSRDILLKEGNIKEEDSMGKKLDDNDLKQVQSIAWQLSQLYDLKKKHETYLNDLMQKGFPNTTAVLGPLIAAKIIEHVGNVERLVKMPASTIQLLGAEKALFRHMKNKKKNPSPKFGILFQHPLVQSAKYKVKGKIARLLADKFAIAVKIDYFKGRFIGDKLKEQIIDRVRSLK